MTRVLAVGLEQGEDFKLEGVEIETLGLCRAEIDADRAAFPLYEYDAIIINPQSFSHFLFGVQTEHSGSDGELYRLKAQRAAYDMDSLFDPDARANELIAAIERGATVIWCLSPSRNQNFFGYRETWLGYCAPAVHSAVKKSETVTRKGREIGKVDADWPFQRLFEVLSKSTWTTSMATPNAAIAGMAWTPDGHSLGGRFEKDHIRGWLTTAPTSQEAARALIVDTVALAEKTPAKARYHGLFLSHTSDDKPFVRRVGNDLKARGVPVWLDEAEIQIGDSLTGKIAEGIKRSRFIAVFLSPKSVSAPWVAKELEIAINMEIKREEVVVLPLVIEKCELPPFLEGKLYGDFTAEDQYSATLEKLLRRLQLSSV
ncbi:toll/interleukin-1 receptor domain-containing protein [Sphingomonas sp.]|uniref:toll/interleukin-1 receptor domain-containing protein n=1 Tax=Sphingomonas sp. TaxID=28214 RepID=UPI003D6D0D91